MKKILLVAPKFDSEFSRATAAANLKRGESLAQSLMTPLHLATIAGLTPKEFHVDIWDEGARGEIDDGTVLEHEYDLVGVTGYIAHLPRAIELAEIFRKRGSLVAIGGPGVSGSPDVCRGVFDIVFLGEAELTWPQFLDEWQRGVHRNEYRQVERPDLSQSPIPCWDSVQAELTQYRLAGVQTTRGCPYDCEFCDVIHLYGRQPRHKPVDRVIEEIKLLQKLGARRIFVCDDDFIGDARYAKEFLRALLPVNNGFDPPLTYSTQLTIDLAHDEELMELMADCNFTQVLVGIETPRAASLQEAHKVQNLRTNMVEDCLKIQSYGIAVKAALVVGFDADDTDIFAEQVQFLDDANIPITTINTIKAYPGTPLWVRLQRENRVVDVSSIYSDSPKVVSNVIPKGMTRVEMLEGYRDLLKSARSWESVKKRTIAFVSSVTRRPKVTPPSEAVRQERLARLESAKQMIEVLPKDTRAAITEVVMHTFATAPYLMETVSSLLMQQFMDSTLIPYHSEIIQRQIDQTNSGELKLDRDKSAGMIPKGFKTALRDVMPQVYGRLEGELNNKTVIPEAIVDVFKDFLIRWSAHFERFEDYHEAYLGELCDRHIERWNGNGNGSTNGNGHGKVVTGKEVQSSKFITAMLVAVEQDLRGEVRTDKGVADVPLTVEGVPAA